MKPTIGLEIHAQLLTNTKSRTRLMKIFMEPKPNSKTCPVSLGHPGTLPVSNTKVIEYACKNGCCCWIRNKKKK